MDDYKKQVLMMYGGLVSLGGKMKIVSPEALEQRYKEWIRKSIGEEGETIS